MKIKINLNESSGGSVFIDDIEVLCRALSYVAAVGKSPKLILDVIGEVEIQGESNVILRLPNGNMFQVSEHDSAACGYYVAKNIRAN